MVMLDQVCDMNKNKGSKTIWVNDEHVKNKLVSYKQYELCFSRPTDDVLSPPPIINEARHGSFVNRAFVLNIPKISKASLHAVINSFLSVMSMKSIRRLPTLYHFVFFFKKTAKRESEKITHIKIDAEIITIIDIIRRLKNVYWTKQWNCLVVFNAFMWNDVCALLVQIFTSAAWVFGSWYW